MHVLGEYKTSATVSVSGDLVGDTAAAAAAAGDGASAAVAKSRQRLETLTTGAARSEGAPVALSQSEYAEMIHRMHSDLRQAWEGGDFVLAIKIAIQATKLLRAPDVPAFYPSMFVLVTSLLDTFGNLVFMRLKARAEAGLADMAKAAGGRRTVVRLPDNFRPEDIGSEARETARNWLFKIACIRELLPRLYMECALLEVYRFLSDADFAAILTRLSHTVRGLADPLVASYARWYLARALHRLLGGEAAAERVAVMAGVQDFFSTYHLLGNTRRQATLQAAGYAPGQYTHLFKPALGWQFHQLATAAVLEDGGVAGAETRRTFQSVMRQYKAVTGPMGDMTVLYTILDAFPGELYASYLPTVLELVEAAVASTAVITQHSALAAIARRIAAAPSEAFPEEHRLPFLNGAWGLVSALDHEDIDVFLEAGAAFMQLLAAHFGRPHLLTLLQDIARHVVKAVKVMTKAVAEQQAAAAAGEAGEALPTWGFKPATQEHLADAMHAVVAFESDLSHIADEEERAYRMGGETESLLTHDYLPRLLEAFSPAAKRKACRRLLKAFNAQAGSVGDALLVDTMLDIARPVSLGVDALATVDARREVDELLVAFVAKLDFGRDLEGQLAALTHAREVFPPTDAVTEALVGAGLRLVHKALDLVDARAAKRGSARGAAAHTAGTASFVKTAIAFVHITVPIHSAPLMRMRLFAAEGVAAHANACLSQADSAFMALVSEIPAALDVIESGPQQGSRASQEDLTDFLTSLLPALAAMPGSPHYGPFHLMRGILAATAKVEWAPNRAGRATVLVAMLSALALMGQAALPGTLLPPGAVWNGTLYAGDPAYEDELTDVVQSVVQEVYTALDALAAAGVAGDTYAAMDHATLAQGAFQAVVRGLHLTAGAHPAVAGLNKLLPALVAQLRSNPHPSASMTLDALGGWSEAGLQAARAALTGVDEGKSSITASHRAALRARVNGYKAATTLLHGESA